MSFVSSIAGRVVVTIDSSKIEEWNSRRCRGGGREDKKIKRGQMRKERKNERKMTREEKRSKNKLSLECKTKDNKKK